MQVAVSIIRDIIYSAVAAGASLQAICQAASLSPEALQEERSYDLSQVNAVWQAAVTQTGNPLIGLHAGEQVHFESIGIVGFTMQNSPDLYTAFERATYYNNIYSSLLAISLQSKKETVRVQFTPLPVFVHTFPEAARQSVESSMAFAAKAAEKLSGKRITPQLVRFGFPAPVRRLLPAYEQVFGSILVFGEPESELLFATRDLQSPVVTYNQRLYQLLDVEAEKRLQARKDGQNFTGQVRQVIAGLLKGRYVGVEGVASALGTSVRTLQRKLQEEGQTFGQVLEAQQHAYAVAYLKESSLTIAEIGYLLGYAEPGVFTKAFKRWTGRSPSEFRQQKP